jgi:hypothetical protein
MPTCCNFECHGHIWGTKLRCSQCRNKKKYNCANCDYELSNNRKILCDSCVKERNNIYHYEYNRLNRSKKMVIQ